MSDADVTHLPPRASSLRRHSFGEPVSVTANPALGRHAQTERACNFCGAVKVTVHPPEGGGWREWRRGASTAQVFDEPPCEMQIYREALLRP